MKTSFRVRRDALERLLEITPETPEEDLVDRINKQIVSNVYGDDLRRIVFDGTKAKRGERDIKITVEIDTRVELVLRSIAEKIRKIFSAS